MGDEGHAYLYGNDHGARAAEQNLAADLIRDDADHRPK